MQHHRSHPREPISRSTCALVVAGAVLLAACGGANSDPEHPPAHHGPAGHGHGEGHPDHGDHHTHSHASPAELRPLMRDLRGWLGDLRGALDAGETEAAETPARAIATACDDAELQPLDPELFGPRFSEIDRELHGAAETVATAASAGDLAAARDGYADVARACVTCHSQAPSASHVDLGELVPPRASEE